MISSVLRRLRAVAVRAAPPSATALFVTARFVTARFVTALFVTALFATGCAGSSPQPLSAAVKPASAEPGSAEWPPAPVVPLPTQPAPTLEVDQPLPDQLAAGLVVIRYRAHNLRFVPVYGPNALDVSPRVGHIHVVVDNAPWHWADASGEPLIIQSLPAGPHTVWIGLADPTHKIMDSRTVSFVVPPHPSHPH